MKEIVPQKTLTDVLTGLGIAKDIERMKEDAYSRVLEKIAPEELRKRILTLKMVIDVSYFEMGGYLYWVHHKGYYKKWGFETWTQYVEEEVGFALRKAEYLEKIWFYVDSLKIPLEKKKKLIGLGWDKVKEVIGVVTKDNVDEIVDKGQKKTSLEFKAEVKSNYKGEDQVGIQKRFTTYLWEDQHATVSDAIEKAKEVGKTDKIGHALSLICLSYLSEMVDMKDWRESLVRVFKKYEKVFGLKMLVVDDKDNLIYRTKGFGEE